MAIDFPDSPTDGQVFGERKYNASKGVWEWYVLPGDTTAEDLLLPGQAIAYSVEYLVIAGGGGGGGSSNTTGGGGGAGGYRSSVPGENSGGLSSPEPVKYFAPGESANITVGAGGTGTTSSNGTNGENSVFSDIISLGGGYGASRGNTGGTGGSGGGGGDNGGAAGSGTENQGFDGASGASAGSSGNGGGAGGPAQTHPFAFGPGIVSSITGSSIVRSQGGDISTSVSAAQPNLGRGGNGTQSSSSLPGSNGGSGIVIIKYSSAISLSIDPGLVSTTDDTTVPGYKITSFTSGTGTVSIS